MVCISWFISYGFIYTRHILFVNFTAEVLEAKRNSDREQLNKLKEQLLISFKDQMELRYFCIFKFAVIIKNLKKGDFFFMSPDPKDHMR